ncbi:MAG: hypothetical protein HY759_05760 [Nitrospirae bacterium]|nr:hypothetical protein [Nitrospirota bacterium]
MPLLKLKDEDLRQIEIKRSEALNVDIAVEGLPYEHIYKVEAKIEEILGGIEFDLIYTEYAPDYLVASVKKRGEKYACHIS